MQTAGHVSAKILEILIVSNWQRVDSENELLYNANVTTTKCIAGWDYLGVLCRERFRKVSFSVSMSTKQ